MNYNNIDFMMYRIGNLSRCQGLTAGEAHLALTMVVDGPGFYFSTLQYQVAKYGANFTKRSKEAFLNIYMTE